MASAEDVIASCNLPRPYASSAANFIYNLLFCDVPALFTVDTSRSSPQMDPLHADPPDLDAVRRIAGDKDGDSRMRMLAFNLLRGKGASVPAKIVLGVIFEVPQAKGLDTLACFADNSARYVNQTGKLAVFEGAPTAVVEKAAIVLAKAQPIVDKIGPWDKKRLPPPTRNVRMTFLVSDGLYFGEGAYGELMRDALAAPLLAAAVELLMAATSAVVPQKPNP